MLLCRRLPQIVLIERVVSLEYHHRFMPRDLHSREGVYPGPAHISHGRVPEVMKVKVDAPCLPTCRVERASDTSNGLPVTVKNMAGGAAYG